MRTICGALLLSAIAATGCTHGFGFLGFDTKPAAQVATPKPPPGPVTADQVNSANAHQVAKVLSDEMDRAAKE